MNTSPQAGTVPAMQLQDFDTLDAILDELRTRYEQTPQWEFCDGFLTALVCCRREIPEAEWLPVLLSIGEGPDEETGEEARWADAAQQLDFMRLWHKRSNEVRAALDAEVESLEDERAFVPEVLDVRGNIAALPEEERAAFEGDDLPSFAQVWALGFMFAVENWPEEWQPPRDKDMARAIDAALSDIVALTEDDTDEPTLSASSEDGPPSVSQSRLDAYALGIWAVYDLRAVWQSVGPRVATVRHAEAKVGRNDPCPCGSGKKYKKCCGADA
jgi:uncharacterized protein